LFPGPPPPQPLETPSPLPAVSPRTQNPCTFLGVTQTLVSFSLPHSPNQSEVDLAHYVSTPTPFCLCFLFFVLREQQFSPPANPSSLKPRVLRDCPFVFGFTQSNRQILSPSGFFFFFFEVCCNPFHQPQPPTDLIFLFAFPFPVCFFGEPIMKFFFWGRLVSSSRLIFSVGKFFYLRVMVFQLDLVSRLYDVDCFVRRCPNRGLAWLFRLVLPCTKTAVISIYSDLSSWSLDGLNPPSLLGTCRKNFGVFFLVGRTCTAKGCFFPRLPGTLNDF